MPVEKNENIKWLRHDEIDFLRWDQIIESSSNCRVYACTWYLDLVTEKWDALVWGDYKYLMPVPNRKKWGIRYVYQPYFTQQLGIYPSPPGNIQQEFAVKLSESFGYINYQAGNSLLPEKFPAYNFSTRRNRSLSLNTDYDTLVRDFSENTVRNIRKAGQNRIFVKQDLNAGEYVRLKKKVGRVNVPEETFRILENLMNYTKEKGTGRIYSAKAPDGEIAAGAFFLFHKARVYYLNAFSTEAGMVNASAFAIVDSFCREFTGSGLILDFEGSEIEGIDRFYKGFGAKEDLYWLLSYSRIPFFIFQLKKKLHL